MNAPVLLKEWWEKIRDGEAAKTLLENRNVLKECPLCLHSIEDRSIAIYQELIGQLYEIYRWCGEHGNEFSMKDIRHLLDHNGYARFNDLIQCSNGVLYRPSRGKYGMNMGRAKEFFNGLRPVHLQVSINGITGEMSVMKDCMVSDLPSLKKLLVEVVYDYERIL